MSATPRLGYVVRFVDDLDACVRFYKEVLGQRLTKRTAHWAQFDGGGVTFGLYDRQAMARNLDVEVAELGRAPGALELAFEVGDVDAAFAAAIAKGAREYRRPENRPWGERTGYILDPDGALVELYARAHEPAEDEDEEAHDIERGAASGAQQRADEMATPSSESRAELSDPSD